MSPGGHGSEPRRPLHGISDIRAFFHTNTVPLYFISPTPFNLLGIDRWVRNFFYLTYFDSFEGAHSRVFVPRRRDRIDFDSMGDVCNHLLRDPETLEFIARRGPGGKACFVMMDEETQALARQAGLEVMHPPVELRHRLGSKIVMTRLADEAGVPSVPHVIGRAGSYDELSALAESAGLGDDLVVVAAYGDAGSTVFFVRGQRDWDDHAGDLAGQEVKVMKRIRNVEVVLEGAVTRHGTVIGPAMTSLVGYPELTPGKGSWCGNDIWREVLPPAQTHAAREMVRKLGDILSREGYRGYFEVDLLHDLDSDELYLGEVNPRLSGASPMTNLTTEAYADMPLFLFHLLEYMDVEYELDIDEINSRWERGYGEDEVWGQLIHQRDLTRCRDFHRDATHRCVAHRRRRACLLLRAPPTTGPRCSTGPRPSTCVSRRLATYAARAPNSACSSPAGTCRPPTTSSPSAAGAGSKASRRSSPQHPWRRHADRLAARRTSVSSGGVPAGISLDNWLSPPHSHWSFQHVEDFVPTAVIPRGTGPTAALPAAGASVAEIQVTNTDGVATTVGAVMATTATDGWAVAYRGSMVAEEYLDGLQAQTRHLLFSVSKSLVAAVVGALHGAGAIELDAPVTAYVPALANCGYAGATVRHLLDMRSGIAFSDNYLHPTAEVHVLDEAIGWAPAEQSGRPLHAA